MSCVILATSQRTTELCVTATFIILLSSTARAISQPGYEDCSPTPGGRLYRGSTSVTASGKQCKAWAKQWPHNHKFDKNEYFPGEGVEEAKNYCRNPDANNDDVGLWCFTTDRQTRREKCNVPQCAGKSYHSSCKEIKAKDNSAASGEYTIETSAKRLVKVYCEMGLNGGGYTFIQPADMERLTNEEVQTTFTDKSSFLLRIRRDDDAAQPYGIVKQMSTFKRVPLKLGLNENTGYVEPINVNLLSKPYLYYGFVPKKLARNDDVQGVMVNGVDITFDYCKDNPSSQMTLFPNFGKVKSQAAAVGQDSEFCETLLSTLAVKPNDRALPVDYFTFIELNFAGCGCYSQTDGRDFIDGSFSGAVGFR